MEITGNKRKVQNTLNFFVNKRRAVETNDDRLESSIDCSDDDHIVEIVELKSSESMSQAAIGGIDISKSKHEDPVRPTLDVYPANDKNRRFSSFYYKAHDWIEYSASENVVYCYACRHFAGISTMKGDRNGQRAFIDVGFKKWNDMKALFDQHASSSRHKSAMISWAEWKANKVSIASKSSTMRSSEVLENRKHVKNLLCATSSLGCQGIAFRGHEESESSTNKGNFVEFLETLAETDVELKSRIERRYGHHMSPEYQNDMIQVFGNRLESTIKDEIIETVFFAILVDEIDTSKKRITR